MSGTVTVLPFGNGTSGFPSCFCSHAVGVHGLRPVPKTKIPAMRRLGRREQNPISG